MASESYLTRVRHFGALPQLLAHPLNRRHRLRTLLRYGYWHLRSRVRPAPQVVTYADDRKLIAYPGMTTVIYNHMVGLRDCAEMALLLHVLRPSDLFLDVGANVGTYAVLASAACGARTIAVEPGSVAYERLRTNAALNDVSHLMQTECCAVGETDGVIRFSAAQDTINYVVPSSSAGKDAIEVPMHTVDTLLEGRAPEVMKLDIEGYEYAALRGATRTLARPELRMVIIEVNGSGRKYGVSDRQAQHLLTEAGFGACSYDPFLRVLMPLSQGVHRSENIIYARDFDWLGGRIRSAAYRRINAVVI